MNGRTNVPSRLTNAPLNSTHAVGGIAWMLWRNEGRDAGSIERHPSERRAAGRLGRVAALRPRSRRFVTMAVKCPVCGDEFETNEGLAAHDHEMPVPWESSGAGF